MVRENLGKKRVGFDPLVLKTHAPYLGSTGDCLMPQCRLGRTDWQRM